MPEMIDKEKLLEYLAAIKPDEYVSAYGEAAVDVINHVETYVNAMPTIEPEVRHGRLKKKNGEIYCTNCKKSRWTESFASMLRGFDFCPKCGADMREEGADNG